MSEPARARAEVTICNSKGLHARASAKFVKCAETFCSDIQVTRDGHTVDATSIMGLLMFAAGPGAELIIEATGCDAEQAVAALIALVAGGFGEDS